jgi:hypothetical protein
MLPVTFPLYRQSGSDLFAMISVHDSVLLS